MLSTTKKTLASVTGTVFELFSTVTMPTVPESTGWVRALGTNAFGVPSAEVVWEHHNGVRAIIPLHQLQTTETKAERLNK